MHPNDITGGSSAEGTDSDDLVGGYSAEEAEAINDQGAAEYDSTSHLSQKDIPKFIDLANLQPGERVLDLGCGNAAMAIAAKSKVGTGRVVGVDISAQMLGFGRRRVEDAGLDGQVELLKGSVFDLSAVAASNNWQGFDVILCRRLICNLQDRQVAALTHISSFLAPGSRIITDQIYPYQLIATASNTGVPGEFPPFILRVGTNADWRKIEDHFRQQVQNAGLRFDTVQNLSQDGFDVSAQIVEEARKKWTSDGMTSEMPDTFLEFAKWVYLGNKMKKGEGRLEYAAILCLLRRA
ncbi:hypothetical protein MMC30_004767 [Trapelia coarctata]|nr:hypothetical protein [Trapelia coarctata]